MSTSQKLASNRWNRRHRKRHLKYVYRSSARHFIRIANQRELSELERLIQARKEIIKGRVNHEQ